MRFYENILKTSENRVKPRGYYIPKGISEYTLKNKQTVQWIRFLRRAKRWQESALFQYAIYMKSGKH